MSRRIEIGDVFQAHPSMIESYNINGAILIYEIRVIKQLEPQLFELLVTKRYNTSNKTVEEQASLESAPPYNIIRRNMDELIVNYIHIDSTNNIIYPDE